MTIGHGDDAGRFNAVTAAVIVAELYAAGVRDAVISPGSRNTPLVLALHAASQRWSEFSVSVVVDERSAGFFALGVARATGRPVILSCSSGSAGTHYHPALVEADCSGIPLVAITADRPPELHDRGAPQTVNQQRMFEPHVRASLSLPPGDDAEDEGEAAARARTAAQAIRRALLADRSGPVHLNVQAREPLWPHAWSSADFVSLLERIVASTRCVERSTPALPAAASIAARGLASVRRGLILVGPVDPGHSPGGSHVAALRSTVFELAERLRWPILADPASQLRIGDTKGAIVCRQYDAFLRSAPFATTHVPECVVAFGRWPTSKTLGQFLAKHRVSLVSVQADGATHNPWGLPALERRAPTLAPGATTPDAPTLKALETDACVAAETGPAEPSSEGSRGERLARPDAGWAKRWQRADRTCEELARECSAEGFWEATICEALEASLEDGMAVHVGSSMPIRNLDDFLRTHPDDCPIYASRGVNGIDGTIATAAGEARGSGRPLVAWMGDVTFLHDAGSLAWVEPTTPLTLLVTDNGGGGIFHYLPIAANDDVFERYFVTPPAVDVVRVARGYGWPVEEVDTADALVAALRSAKEASRGGSSGDRRRVIVARVDRARNLSQYRAFFEACDQRLRGAAISPPPSMETTA